MRVMLSLPKNLVDEFKAEGATEFPRIAAFHRAHGNEETVEAVETAANATNSL